MAIDVSSTEPVIAYFGNGEQVEFAVPFVFFNNGDLRVYVNRVRVMLDVDYTVTGARNPEGGMVTLLSAPGVGVSVVILRESLIERKTHFPVAGPFNTETLNLQLNQVTTWVQELKAKFQRFLRQPDEDVLPIPPMPSKDSRRNTVLLWDADGNPVPGPSAADISSASNYAANAAASADAAALAEAGAIAAAAKIPDPSGPPDAHKLLQVNDEGTAYRLSTVSITGDVTGPAESTAHAIALFASATGKVLKNGPALGTAGHVLKSGGPGQEPAFGQVTAEGIQNNTITLNKLARVGNAGQVLTSQGVNGDPVFANLPPSGEVNTGQNVGTGSGVFKQKSGATLQFKSIRTNNAANFIGTDVGLGWTLTDVVISVGADADNVIITITRTFQARSAPPDPGGA